ncbi:hypothetical protein ACFL43_07260 [Thermodesulfobacteriota bacterium]
MKKLVFASILSVLFAMPAVAEIVSFSEDYTVLNVNPSIDHYGYIEDIMEPGD